MKVRIRNGCLLLLTLLLAWRLPLAVYAEEETEVSALGVSAASAIVIEAESGQVVYQKDATTRRPMASTTKIMTALIAIEKADLSAVVTIPKEAIGVEGSSVYLTLGEKMTMEDLLYALMLASANDAATAIAVLVSGSVEAFAEEMNRKAKELGLEDTSFDNPHGLDSENHYTTAYDLARLTAYALKNPTFRTIVSTQKTTIPFRSEEGRRYLQNHNRLLRSYEGCIGVKTGYTKRCGRCLVSAAEREGLTLVAVTLNAPDDWNDHRLMLDYGFSQLERVTLTPEGLSGTAPVVGGVEETVSYTLPDGVSVLLSKEEHQLRQVIEMSRFYYAPIEEGQLLGRVVFYDGATEIASLPITASQTVEKRKEKRNFWQWLLSLFS